MKTHWMKILTVGAGTSLILFQAGADEIEDAFKAAQAAEITRTVEDEQAARRALIRARERLLAESAGQNVDPTAAAVDAEDLAGEINSLEDLKAKLKRELDSLRELDVPDETPAATETAPDQAVASAPVQVGATPEEWQAFQKSINQQVANWREQDLKQAVEQRAAVRREQQSLKDAISTLIEDVDERIASLTEKREAELSDLAEKLERQQDQLKAQEARLSDQITASQADVAAMTASINEKLEAMAEAQAGKDELKRSLEAMIGDLDAEIKTLKLAQEKQKSGDQELEALAKEIQRQVAEAPVPEELMAKLDEVDADQTQLQEDLMEEIASLRKDLARQPKPVDVDTADIEKKIRTELMGEMRKEIDRLNREMVGRQEQTAQALAALKGDLEQSKALADAVETLSSQVEDSQDQMVNLKKTMDKRAAEIAKSSPSLSKRQRAEQIQYRKALQDEVAQLRQELRDALKTEIAELSAAIEVEKAARLESADAQEAKLAALESSLKDQIAQSLADMPSGTATDEDAVLAAVHDATKALNNDFGAFKASIEETLASFKEQSESRQSHDLSKFEFMLNQYMAEINEELASLKEGSVVVASAVTAAVVAPDSADSETSEEGGVDKPEEPEEDDIASQLSPEEQEQRASLLELRERLRASIDEYKQMPAAEEDAQDFGEAVEQVQSPERTDERADGLVEAPVEESAKPKKKKSWFNIWGGGDDETTAVEESAAEPVEDLDEAVQVEIDERVASTDIGAVEEAHEEDLSEDMEEVEGDALTQEVEDESKKGFWSRLFKGGKDSGESTELPGLTVSNEVEDVQAEVEEVPADEPSERPEVDEPDPMVVRTEDLKSPAEVAGDVEIVEEAPEQITTDDVVEAEDTVEEVGADLTEDEVQLEEEPKQGFFGRLFGRADSSEDRKEILDLNGDDAEPQRNGEEAKVVEEIRGQLDRQILVINQELDQHPIFDLEEVDVAPTTIQAVSETSEKGEWKYTGGWLKGQMHGAGSLTYPDGRMYEGEWEHGLRQGKGTLTHPDGWIFEGDWSKGLINGQGALRYEDGWSYEGSWNNGRMDGVGVLTHPDGWTYTGEWSSGAMDGEGRLEHEDGWAYEGNWVNGVREGEGSLTHQDGWTYEGDWHQGHRSGKGTLTFSDGWSYTGEWKDGTMNGYGRLNHPDGWAYEGNWATGSMAGEGSIVIED